MRWLQFYLMRFINWFDGMANGIDTDQAVCVLDDTASSSNSETISRIKTE